MVDCERTLKECPFRFAWEPSRCIGRDCEWFIYAECQPDKQGDCAVRLSGLKAFLELGGGCADTEDN